MMCMITRILSSRQRHRSSGFTACPYSLQPRKSRAIFTCDFHARFSRSTGYLLEAAQGSRKKGVGGCGRKIASLLRVRTLPGKVRSDHRPLSTDHQLMNHELAIRKSYRKVIGLTMKSEVLAKIYVIENEVVRGWRERKNRGLPKYEDRSGLVIENKG